MKINEKPETGTLKTHLKATDVPTLRIGIGGNYYVICTEYGPLVDICEKINKSKNSIYVSGTYSCFAIRIKCQKQKLHLKLLLAP